MKLSLLPPDWRQIQRKNFSRWEPLADFLELSPEQREKVLKKSKFPLNLPLRLAKKIEKGSLDDPILKQFLPLTDEEIVTEGFVFDPVGDEKCRPASKLLHKYHGRVLLVCTSSCAMHCRYCFRRHFDYSVNDPTFDKEIDLIANDSSIHEVILSGGDPLSLSNNKLKSLIERLSEISHLTKLRFHSRFPIGIPERIDEEFLEIIENTRLKVWFVIHCNHPSELDDEILERLNLLQRRGVVVMNQAVLLKGVNDHVDTMAALCLGLVDAGILPYYVHQLDRVQGGAHFEVEEAEGLKIVEKLRSLLPGYAVPRYVREISGRESKTDLK
ncbi:MAG: KamA family radical SAM protein [Chlamydiota bacterium]|nr:KamA family radical SAM protein [Chlamydiota bacterium]